MAEGDKFKITIRVADVPEFTLTIRREEEEYYRRAVKQVNKLWSDWKQRDNSENSDKIIAVIALKFARKLYEIIAQVRRQEEFYANQQNEINDVLSNFEEAIDKILLELPDTPTK